jgi:hypothetical protein
MTYRAGSFHPTLTNLIINSPGPVNANDADMDPDGIMSQDNGLNLSAVNYSPKFYFRSIVIRGGPGGQSAKILRVIYKIGAYFDWPVNVDANSVMEIEGQFVGIDYAHTTCGSGYSSLVFPFI